MAQLKVVGGDLGNDAFKVVYGPNQKYILRNAVKRVFQGAKRKNLSLDSKDPEILDDLDVLIENEDLSGRFYVGELAVKQGEDHVSPETRKLHNKQLIVPLLTMLALNIPEGEKEIRVAIGCGLPIHEYSDDRGPFAERLKGTYKVTFQSGTLKNREVTIIIEQVVVLPEGIAVIMNQSLNATGTGFKDKELLKADSGVVDIGAFSTDIGIILKGSPDSDVSEGLGEGIANYLDAIVAFLNDEYKIKMTRAQLVDRLEKNDFIIPILDNKVNVEPMMKEQFQIFAGKIVGRISEIWKRHYTISQFFIAGGGSKALRPYLEAEAKTMGLAPLTFFEGEDDPQMQNASGYWKFAVTKFAAAGSKGKGGGAK